MVINNYKKRIIQTIFISLICAFFMPTSSFSDVLNDIMEPSLKNYCGTIPSSVQRDRLQFGDLQIRNIFAVEALPSPEKSEWESELNVFFVIQNTGEDEVVKSFETSMKSEVFLASETKNTATLKEFEAISLPKNASIIYRGRAAYLKVKTIDNSIPKHSTFALSINFKNAGSISFPVPILTQDEFAFLMEQRGLQKCKVPSNAPLETPR